MAPAAEALVVSGGDGLNQQRSGSVMLNKCLQGGSAPDDVQLSDEVAGNWEGMRTVLPGPRGRCLCGARVGAGNL